jgi:hypothetical protein
MKIILNRSYFNLFLIFFFFASVHIQCTNGFENVIEINEDVFEEKIAVTAQLYVDSLPSITISKNINISNNNFPIIEDAAVNLISNNESYPFEFNDQALRYEPVIPFDLELLKNYELQVNHSTLGNTSARQQLLSSPTEIEVIPSTSIFNSDSSLNLSTEFTLSFKDPKNEENFYIIEGESIGKRLDFDLNDTIYDRRLMGVKSSSNLVEFKTLWRIYLRDEHLDGETITIPFYCLSVHNTAYQMKVNLTSTTREGYLHELSITKYQESLDNPFVEPVIIFSNMEGGLGVFSLNSLSTFSFP